MPRYLTLPDGRKIVLDSESDDTAITAAAQTDPDAMPLSDAQWERVRHTVRRGRPSAPVKRPMLSMRVDPDILEHLRASGKGWQSKVRALLRKAVKKGEV